MIANSEQFSLTIDGVEYPCSSAPYMSLEGVYNEIEKYEGTSEIENDYQIRVIYIDEVGTFPGYEINRFNNKILIIDPPVEVVETRVSWEHGEPYKQWGPIEIVTLPKIHEKKHCFKCGKKHSENFCIRSGRKRKFKR